MRRRRALLQTSAGGTVVRHYVIPTRTGLDSGPAAITLVGQPVRAHGDAQTFVRLFAEVSSANEGDAVVEGSLSGYLVDQ